MYKSSGKFSHQKSLTYLMICMFTLVYAVMSRQNHHIFHKETKLIDIQAGGTRQLFGLFVFYFCKLPI